MIAARAVGGSAWVPMLRKQLVSSFATHSGVVATDAPVKPMNIWCIGRNYAEHIKELDSKAPDGEPMVFLKAGSAMLAPDAGIMPLPSFSNNVHHEVELCLEFGADLKPVRGFVALDLTLRDLQGVAKKQGYPWTLSKSFRASNCMGTPFSLAGLNLEDLELELQVNGKTRQKDITGSMIFKIPTLLEYVLDRFPVVPGDLLMTGTPAGVSPLMNGDAVAITLRKGRGGEVLSSAEWTVEHKNKLPLW